MENLFINKAILDTIWLWQKSECRYYKAMQYAYSNRENVEAIENFAQKEYLEYLIGYKVKRTIKGEGAEPLIPLLKDIFKEGGFAEHVMKFSNNPEFIDRYVNELAEERKDISDGKKMVSLILKTAFLLRPDILPLYDGKTKDTLIKKMSQKIDDFTSYFEAYIEFKNEHIKKVEDQLKHFDHLFKLFDELKNQKVKLPGNTRMKKFIAHRSIDKLLWLQNSR